MHSISEDNISVATGSETIVPRQYHRSHTDGSITGRRPRGSIVRRGSSLKKFSAVISTEDYNSVVTPTFHGPYAHIRKELDYSYHCYYRKERQWLQDSIIEDLLDNVTDKNLCITPTEPWLIFTVGPRGAGKKHVVRELVDEGRLSLLSFVHVDADEIRRRLPEFQSYLKRSPDLVDELTRKESGHIAEILALAGLQAGRNVIIDGSMQDAQWHIELIEKLRTMCHHLNFRFGILQITAPAELVMKRVRKKALETGRDIPEETIISEMKGIQQSIKEVKPHVDFYCQIRNGVNGHELRGDIDWVKFQHQFLQACAWKPGMKGKQKLVRHFSREESQRTFQSTVQRAKRNKRRFSVLISSEENNRSEEMDFFGKYSHIRKTLDYNYHANYTFERQKLQDAIISDMLDSAVIFDVEGNIGTVPTMPWIVFTAGAMGAGKSHTMNQLVENGRFPLKAFVIVDPDEIRRLLPEYHMYIEENPELAGELTRKEAGFIAEILTLAALQAGKNVLQDGSLRDSDWYQIYFSRLRDEFPGVRQAIIHVTAPKEAVLQRAAERAILTGRIVPRETLEAALEQVPRSVKILAPLVDYYAEINNDQGAPDVELTKPVNSDWDTFRQQWNQVVAYVPNRKKILQKAKLQLDGDELVPISEKTTVS